MRKYSGNLGLLLAFLQIGKDILNDD